MTLKTTTVDNTGCRPPSPGTTDPTFKTLVVEVRPDLHRLHVLAGDVLAALGKRRDVSGKGRNEHDDIRHAQAWLHAHHTQDLILTHTQRLHPKILRGVAGLATDAGVERLWLLHEPPRSDAFLSALSHHYSATATLADLPPEALGGAATTEPEQRETPSLPDVPRVEFTSFWSSCQDQLTGDDRELIHIRLTQAVEAADRQLTRSGTPGDAIAARVFAILNAAPTDPELAIDIRGLQIAAWEHDIYVKVDHTRLHHHEERPRLTCERVDEAMRAYRQPYRALTAALARRGLGVEDLTRIRISDADCDAGTITCLGEPIRLTAAAASALRAQLHLRRAASATDHDPLLPHTPKALSKALTDAHVDLGIHIHGRRVERTRNHTTSALRQLGITIHSLA